MVPRFGEFCSLLLSHIPLLLNISQPGDHFLAHPCTLLADLSSLPPLGGVVVERRPPLPSLPGEDRVTVDGAGVLVGHKVVEEGVGTDQAPLEVVVVVGIRGCRVNLHMTSTHRGMWRLREFSDEGGCRKFASLCRRHL